MYIFKFQEIFESELSDFIMKLFHTKAELNPTVIPGYQNNKFAHFYAGLLKTLHNFYSVVFEQYLYVMELLAGYIIIKAIL